MAKYKDKIAIQTAKYRKCSQEELANIVGVSQSNIGRYETGVAEPSLKTLIKIASVLQVSTDCLLGVESTLKQKMLDNDIGNRFCTKLKELRKQNKMTQNDLALILNVKGATVNRYEKGVNEPAFDTLVSIANYFNVTTDYLLGVETSKEEVAPEFSAEQLQVVNLVKKLNNKELEKVYNYLLGIIDARD